MGSNRLLLLLRVLRYILLRRREMGRSALATRPRVRRMGRMH